MVKIREPKTADLPDTTKAAKAEKFGNDALPKVKRTPPYKAINIPFKTEAEYQRLLEAARKDNRKPTDFIKAAIKVAIEAKLGQH